VGTGICFADSDEAPIGTIVNTFSKPIRVAQTAFILFSTFLDLRPVSDASDTDIDIRWVGNSDIQLKNGRLSTPRDVASSGFYSFRTTEFPTTTAFRLDLTSTVPFSNGSLQVWRSFECQEVRWLVVHRHRCQLCGAFHTIAHCTVAIVWSLETWQRSLIWRSNGQKIAVEAAIRAAVLDLRRARGVAHKNYKAWAVNMQLLLSRERGMSIVNRTEAAPEGPTAEIPKELDEDGEPIKGTGRPGTAASQAYTDYNWRLWEALRLIFESLEEGVSSSQQKMCHSLSRIARLCCCCRLLRLRQCYLNGPTEHICS
jgi:hypothetical protein